ncbi:MAG TPA: hypothetical protein VES62_07230 [Thermoleophilaceae bacterium]|nr:hypothetical protein [Thermoleophilaceae bacterium]
MRSIALGGRAPLLATNAVPWPLQADTNFDLASLTFVTPFDLAGLAVLVGAAGPELDLAVVPPADPNVCAYLQRMDLFAVLGNRIRVEPDLPEEGPREPNRALIELHRLEHPDEIDDLSREFWPRLRSRLPQKVCANLFEILGELVDNAATHGASPVGSFIAAQYYSGATSGMPEGMWIGVGDAGIGIRAHLAGNPAYSGLPSDVAAIRRSVQKWVTGTSDRRGWGLVQVLETAGESAPGIVVIRSGRGEGRFYVGPTGTRTARYRRLARRIPGTWIHVLAGHVTT